MKRQHFLTFAITLMMVLFSVPGVHAQNGMSLGGDEICGASSTTECSLKDAKKIVIGAVYNFILPIGSAMLVAFIMFRLIMAYKAYVQGNAGAYKEALEKIINAMIGLFVILLVIGGTYIAALKYIGAQDWVTTVYNLFSQTFIPHAYAATDGTILPNPTSATSLYDLLLLIVRLIVRWFIFPAILVMWVWTGFAYVAAQGAPQKIADAHKWLLWAVVTTVLIMMTEGFLFAVRGTIQQVVPQQQISSPATTAGTADGRTVPLVGQPGAACTVPDTTITGQIATDGSCVNGGSRGLLSPGDSCFVPGTGAAGIIGTDGTCYSGRAAGAANPINDCTNQVAGTVCFVKDTNNQVTSKTGVCGNGQSSAQPWSCY